MAEDWSDINISLDLVDAALRHLHFLDIVDNCEKVLNRRTLRHALRRYEQLWLPMAAKNSSSNFDIIPPIDIAWMWYCHTLSPKEYRYDCRRLIKKTLYHDFAQEENIIRRTNNAIELWYETYPNEGFNIIRSGNQVVGERNNKAFTSSLSVDLVEVAMSQIHFCYQVALPHFRDIKYLESALARYKQFLMLKKLKPDEFLTPSVDVLLMWYTHMAHPLAYAIDTKQLFGHVLPNNIKIKAEAVDEKFVLARENTRELWKKISSEEMVRPGSVFRGQERSREINEISEDEVRKACITAYQVYFSHIELEDLPPGLKKFELRISLLNRERTCEDLKILPGKKRKRMWTVSMPFRYMAGKDLGVRFLLERPSSLWCFKGRTMYATGVFKLGDLLTDRRLADRSLSFEATVTTADGVSTKAVVDGVIDTAIPFLCELELHVKGFRRRVLGAKELANVWGPSALPHTRKNSKHECFIAEHMLTNHVGEDTFHARVIHIPSLLMAGIRIHVRDKLVATSHIIGSSQLPSPEQVTGSEECLTYDGEAGDRAMLIRTFKGDWGLCIGRWVTENGTGFLEIRFKSLMPTRKIKHYQVKTAALHFHSFDGDLQTGNIAINPAQNSVAENLALVFSIGVLHVLCSPTAKDRQLISKYMRVRRDGDGEVEEMQELDQDHLSNQDGSEKGGSTVAREDVQAISVPEQSCAVLLAAGLETQTANNDFILRQYGSLLCDVFTEAHDIVVEERLPEDRGLKSGDEELSERRKRKKKRRSKFKMEVEERKELEKTTESQQSINVAPEVIQEAVGEIRTIAEKRKRKKKKRKSNISEQDQLTAVEEIRDDLAAV